MDRVENIQKLVNEIYQEHEYLRDFLVGTTYEPQAEEFLKELGYTVWTGPAAPEFMSPRDKNVQISSNQDWLVTSLWFGAFPR